jgi:hypothetical protein
MHRGHDHHHHDGGGQAGVDAGHAGNAAGHPGPGHNRPNGAKKVLQWQTPHLGHGEHAHEDHGEPDLDLVEKAFVTGFADAPDPTSFLRLARIPFEATAEDGTRLVLLRVETDLVTDIGAVMPHLGGASFRYDPLPAALVAHRRRLRFVYFDGQGLRPLSLGEVRELREA